MVASIAETGLGVMERVSRIYPNFFSNLSNAHRDLTPKQITLSALLLLQQGNKAIADELGVEVHTVESAKNRLKKKFNLLDGGQLGTYLLKFTVPPTLR